MAISILMLMAFLFSVYSLSKMAHLDLDWLVRMLNMRMIMAQNNATTCQ